MLNTLTLTDETVKYAVEKLTNLIKVNQQRSEEERIDALSLFTTSLGMSDEITSLLMECLGEFYGDNNAYVYIGVLLGLAMSEHSIEYKA